MFVFWLSNFNREKRELCLAFLFKPKNMVYLLCFRENKHEFKFLSVFLSVLNEFLRGHKSLGQTLQQKCVFRGFRI